MKRIPRALLCVAIGAVPAAADEQIVTLGDSLTFAYEASFCYSQTITGLGTIGDGFPLTVRNWIEVLADPTYRGSRFDLGARDSVTVAPPLDPPFVKYFRQAHNWAIPGLKVDGMRRFLAGEASFRDLLDEDPDFGLIDQLFEYSDYTDSDFALATLESQIQSTAERMVIFVGGNDIDDVYGSIYDGNPPGSFVNDFMADMTAVLDFVEDLNPNLQIVIVNVPHVGITPKVRGVFPFDAVKTGRVTAVLQELNSQLRSLARSRGLGYADVFTPTLQLSISAAYPLTIHGNNFGNAGTTPSNQTNPVWLNGTLSALFHPNTNAQTLIANEIIHAFNDTYQTGIPPLTATEMLVNLLGRTAGQADPLFATWFNAYFVGTVPAPVASATDDSDGDGLAAAVEFALGLNPELRDANRVKTRLSGGLLEVAYPLRHPTSSRFTLTPKASADLASPFTPLTPVTGTDGLSRATISTTPGRGFIRLESAIP